MTDIWPRIVSDLKYDSFTESSFHPFCEANRGNLFHCGSDGHGSEYETTNFLNALVKLFKFENILETGCEQAHGTLSLIAACQYNGLGKVTTVDQCDEAQRKSRIRFESYGFTNLVDFVHKSSLDFAKEYDGPPFDFAFFDCDPEIRVEVCSILFKKGKLSKMIMFHDTYRHDLPGVGRSKYSEKVDAFAKENGLIGIGSSLSRGFELFQVVK